MLITSQQSGAYAKGTLYSLCSHTYLCLPVCCFFWLRESTGTTQLRGQSKLYWRSRSEALIVCFPADSLSLDSTCMNNSHCTMIDYINDLYRSKLNTKLTNDELTSTTTELGMTWSAFNWTTERKNEGPNDSTTERKNEGLNNRLNYLTDLNQTTELTWPWVCRGPEERRGLSIWKVSTIFNLIRTK